MFAPLNFATVEEVRVGDYLCNINAFIVTRVVSIEKTIVLVASVFTNVWNITLESGEVVEAMQHNNFFVVRTPIDIPITLV